MTASALIDRAAILLQQHRLADAEKVLREGLASDPSNATLHALLALTLVRQSKHDDAEQEAGLAVTNDPELPLGHYAMAATTFERNRDDEAREAIGVAISLDQLNPDYHALLAQIYLRKSLWRMALNAANDGLIHDPRHSACINARSTALVQLGERDAAAVTMKDALANDPEDAWLHANQGWALLHESKARQSMDHFREALRIDPTNEWAKSGIVESLKASFFLYRWLLRYFLWMSRLTPRAQMGIVVGGYLGVQALRSLSQNNEALRPFVLPLIGAYMAFAVLTWVASAMLNLMLRLHPLGKHVLSWEDRRSSEIVGVLLLATAICLVVGVLAGPFETWLTAAFTCFLTLPAASLIFRCAAGWPRWATLGIALAVFGAGARATWAEYTDDPSNVSAFNTLILFAVVSQFAGQAIVPIRPRR